jgi:hypothetical protein
MIVCSAGFGLSLINVQWAGIYSIYTGYIELRLPVIFVGCFLLFLHSKRHHYPVQNK